MDGALIIDKPAGLTSHDVVARCRRLTGERSIGHLGTLDPMATGVLPLLLGRLTRLAQYFQGRDKTYEGEIRFGFATDTYDAEGEPAGASSDMLPDAAAIAAALPALRGRIFQTPPAFSAKKVSGQRAYALARRHQPVELQPVEVEIRQFNLTGLEGDRMRFLATCSAGAYVRALAHDLGQMLGCGAHLTKLQRTRVGEFELSASCTLQQLAELAAAGRMQEALLPATQLLPEMPAVVAPPDGQARLLQGRAANLPEFSRAPLVRVFTADFRMLAIARRIAGSLFHPQAVFP